MSRGDVYLSEKESRRVYVIERLLEGVVMVKDASCALGLSERQIKRLKAGVKERGIAALAHGNRGRKPKHATPKEVKEASIPNKYTRKAPRRLNSRFAVKAEDKEHAFRASPGVDSLHKIICIKSYRRASKNFKNAHRTGLISIHLNYI